MPIYEYKCGACDHEFEQIVSLDTDDTICEKCGATASKIFSAKGQKFKLTYNPKSDMVDWNGNTSQYYRAYNEAKARGENVRLPEEGE
jgi:putative FmdB family regulatory protein